jgi:hypothetical protein
MGKQRVLKALQNHFIDLAGEYQMRIRKDVERREERQHRQKKSSKRSASPRICLKQQQRRKRKCSSQQMKNMHRNGRGHNYKWGEIGEPRTLSYNLFFPPRYPDLVGRSSHKSLLVP